MPAEAAIDYAAAAAALLGEAPVVRGTEAYFECPFCGKLQPRRKFSVNTVTGLWRCWSCDERGNFAGLQHRLGRRAWAPSLPRVVPTPPAALATAEARDRVYRGFLAHLDLTPYHREELRRRGFSDDEVDGIGARSLPLTGRSRITAAILADLGASALAGVPGFFWTRARNGRPYWTFAGAPGLVLPVRDVEGRVVALRLRPDPGGGSGKYRWLSSGHRRDQGGTACPASLHFVFPGSRPDGPLWVVWVTEGELKAFAITARLGVLAVSVPGVQLWRKLNLIGLLRELGAEAVVLANDADAARNSVVAHETNALAEAVVLAGLPRVSLAAWSPDAGKGIDDVILCSDHDPVLISLRDWRAALPPAVERTLPRPRGPFDVPAEWMLPPAPPREVLSVSDARSRIAGTVGTLLRRPRSRRSHLIVAPTGVGKTRAVLEELVALRCSGFWPTVTRWTRNAIGVVEREPVRMRVAVLFPNRKALWEAYRAHPDLARVAVVQEGRANKRDSPWFCANYARAEPLGDRRHIVRAELCPDCPYFDGCVYLASLEEARAADIVLAVHGTFLTDADELGPGWRRDRRPVHTVVVDEEVLPALVEEVAVDFGRLGEWADGARRCEAREPGMQDVRSLHQVLEQALALTAGRDPREPIPALPVLRDVAAELRIDLSELVGNLRVREDDEGRVYKCWPFERPFSADDRPGHRRFVIPLRLTFDLLRILREELAAARAETRETRLWLARRPGHASRLEPVLLVEVVRRQAIARLRGATMVHCNATPNRPLLQLVFPAMQEHAFEVGAPLIVTQVDNALYTSGYLRQPDRRAMTALQRAINGIATRHDQTTVFCPLEFEPNGGDATSRFQSPAGDEVRWGHYGGDTRALNAYEGCDAVAVVGHHQWPVFQAEALVQALRWTRGVDPSVTHTAASRRRAYNFRRPDGSGRGRIVHTHPDPVVQATLNWSTEAEILQAIGRTRACNRPPDDPVHAYVLTAAVTSLPIDQLVGLPDLLADFGAVPAGAKPGAAALAAANEHRHDAATARVHQAIAGLREAGQPLTVSAICRLGRTGRHIVGRVLREVDRPGIAGAEGGVLADSIKISNAVGQHTPLPMPAADAGAGHDNQPDGGLARPPAPIEHPQPATASGHAQLNQDSRPILRIRWAPERGWLRVRDPCDGQWHDLPARECPEWVRRAAFASRRHPGA